MQVGFEGVGDEQVTFKGVVDASGKPVYLQLEDISDKYLKIEDLTGKSIPVESAPFITAFENAWRGLLGAPTQSSTTGVGGGTGSAFISYADALEFTNNAKDAYNDLIKAGGTADEKYFNRLNERNFLFDNNISQKDYNRVSGDIRNVLGDSQAATDLLAQLDTLAGVQPITKEDLNQNFGTLNEALQSFSTHIVDNLQTSIDTISPIEIMDSSIDKITQGVGDNLRRGTTIPTHLKKADANAHVSVQPATGASNFPVDVQNTVKVEGSVAVSGGVSITNLDALVTYVNENRTDPLN